MYQIRVLSSAPRRVTIMLTMMTDRSHNDEQDERMSSMIVLCDGVAGTMVSCKAGQQRRRVTRNCPMNRLRIRFWSILCLEICFMIAMARSLFPKTATATASTIGRHWETVAWRNAAQVSDFLESRLFISIYLSKPGSNSRMQMDRSLPSRSRAPASSG